MNWKKEAENDLRCYMKRKASLNNLRDQILTLRLEQESIKACTADSEPVKGGGSKTEDRWIDKLSAYPWPTPRPGGLSHSSRKGWTE